MSTTTKRELIEQVAQSTSQPRSRVRTIVQSFLDHIVDEVSKGNRLEFRHFGVFEVRDRRRRMVRNPRTNETIGIAPSRTVRFKCSLAMKRAVEVAQTKSQTRPQNKRQTRSAARNGQLTRSR